MKKKSIFNIPKENYTVSTISELLNAVKQAGGECFFYGDDKKVYSIKQLKAPSTL